MLFGICIVEDFIYINLLIISKKRMVRLFHTAKEEKEIRKIEYDIEVLRHKLIEKVPEHFGRRDMINAFFGSLLIGLTFIFKGALLRTVEVLDTSRIMLIILATFIILIAEIYFIGYSRVKNKNTRHFGQFLTKRLFSLYIISLVVSFLLVYLFGMNLLAGSTYETLKTVVVLTVPCAIGAAVPSLLRQYY